MVGDDWGVGNPAAALTLLAGLQTGVTASGVRCTCCEREQYTGDRVVLYAYRVAGDIDWAVPRLYCARCDPVIDGTLGACEVLVAARIVRATTPAGEPVTALADCDLVATQPPTEGHTAAPG